MEIIVEKDIEMRQEAFQHKSFEERLAEYNGEIDVYSFDWGEPVGEEML